MAKVKNARRVNVFMCAQVLALAPWLSMALANAKRYSPLPKPFFDGDAREVSRHKIPGESVVFLGV